MKPEELCNQILNFAKTKDTGEKPLETGIDGLGLMIRSRPTPIEHTLYQPIFCLVLQGAKQVIFGDKTLNFAKMESLIVSMELPSNGRIIEASPDVPYVGIAIELDIPLLRELAEQVREDEIHEEQAEAIATGSADAELLDVMSRLFALTKKTTARRVLEPLIKIELHYLLLAAKHGSMLRKLCNTDSHAARIAKAIALIRREFQSPLKISDLAAISGMSQSSFHEHFKIITNITPLQFQKQLRLLEARRLLQSGLHTVSSVAFEVGYESPTQFSREYSRMYGTSPAKEKSIKAGPW